MSAQKSPSIFDLDSLRAQFDGDYDIMYETIEMFVQQVPSMLEQIKHAARSKDAKALESAAHSLKGATSNFFAKEVLSQLLGLEHKGREQSLEGIAADIKNAEVLVLRLCEELKKILPKKVA